jgi:hypothetical protein
MFSDRPRPAALPYPTMEGLQNPSRVSADFPAQLQHKLTLSFALSPAESTNTSSVLSSPTKSFEILSLPSPESKPSAKIHRTQNLPTPQFIDHLPRVDDVACTEFEVLKENVFVQKKIGCSHQSLDMMICECQYDPCKCD